MDDTAAAPDEAEVVRAWLPAAWRRWPSAPAVAVFVATRAALLLAALWGSATTGVGSVATLVSGWDGQHYLDIAAFGYPRHPDLAHYSEVAYLPGYPLVVRVLRNLLHLSVLEAALLVSFAAGVALVVAVVRLVSLVVDPAAGVRAGVVLAVFPGSFVLSLPYAEALALLFCVAAFVALARDRALRAGAWGALATVTSPVMIPLVAVLALRAWRRRDGRYLAAGALASLGFLSYCAFLWWRTGRPGAWFIEQTEGFAHHPSLGAPLEHLRYWPGVGLTEVLSLVVLAAGLGALVRVRAPLEWTAFALLVMGVVLFDSGTWANPRFVLNAFPLLLGLGVWARRRVFWVMTASFATLLPVVFLLYMTHGSLTAQP